MNRRSFLKAALALAAPLPAIEPTGFVPVSYYTGLIHSTCAYEFGVLNTGWACRVEKENEPS